jgi:tRNA(Ile)-lysidine synthase
MNFEQRVSQSIEKNKLIAPRGLVVVGVSGGADSMALLAALAGLRHHLGIQLHAVHFNHRFRPESLHDEQFVVRWCRQFIVPLTVGQRTGRRIKQLSEDDARSMRFGFFVKTALHLKAQSVALAHTRNDLAETVLMRLMRGSGLYGLRAIRPQRRLDGVVFVRPLLEFSRSDVESYLKTKKIPFCTDRTNQQTVYERNKVRLKLLPLLAQEYNPKIINALSDLAETAGEDYEFLAMHASKQFEKNAIISKEHIKIGLKGISHQHPAILRLMLRQMVESLTKEPVALSFDHIHALEHLITTEAQGHLDLPHHLKAVKTQKFLELFYA